MAHDSSNGGYPDTINSSWADGEQDMSLCGRAIRSGETQLCQNAANETDNAGMCKEAVALGYRSGIALPLAEPSLGIFGALVVYSDEVNSFTVSEISLLEEMAGDLAFGVHTLLVRTERDLALKKNQSQLFQLQNSLESTVRAIALMVEIRDPYTAGHQNRVAHLAAAIAEQMRLPDEQIHGIQMAGIVHDLGKIQIPAEILSKPGRISEIEFALIKSHAQAGYNILKDIDFPWPVAQMVLQHYERLDGSGYPQGLKGDAILQGARILTVADVVEAMSSHRPYRPGLGVDAAMEEVIRGRGTHYDPSVVDACLTLFKEHRYAFPI
jgi:HD-GYP domain-containing protein (c-di-GMP phosphodiesterase class II)